ncbi:hypothetical protein D0T11_09180 [Hymenobacter rubripertinctus]|uniref:Uncharacterized protein n=1 Tax=Hymenobacter rubripertinctus TaxID=2029981 RepID=A0A418R068_9BACT|nr:hypothetical protein D0T11_09180 [Hymenobacter rubripertinctus]
MPAPSRSNEAFFVARPQTGALVAHAPRVRSGCWPIDQKDGKNGGTHFHAAVWQGSEPFADERLALARKVSPPAIADRCIPPQKPPE